jgi:alpha-mannosidase
MDRRGFLKSTASILLCSTRPDLIRAAVSGTRLQPAGGSARTNPNWAADEFAPKATASSYYVVPPWGYRPANVFTQDQHFGWQADQQLAGAWLEISFPEPRVVKEVWILAEPLPWDVVGSDPYLATYSRSQFYAPPRRVRCALSGGATVIAEIPNPHLYQIIRFPHEQRATSLRILVEEVWSRPGTTETGISKVKVFPEEHISSFEVEVHTMYDVREGRPEQAATLEVVNPGHEAGAADLIVSQNGTVLSSIRIGKIPGSSVSRHSIWLPAPFADQVFEFEIRAESSPVQRQSLKIPAYHSYFDKGTFAINCTCHNDLGWLNVPQKTGDFRSQEIILPALKLLEEYPEFRYSMESTVYLMEFLERHPEKRAEMRQRMNERRFAWGASYVQCQEVHVGPEKLVRQFYYGKRWLRETFAGVDSETYYKTDPPALTLQMPQILSKAGVKYLIQGRLPFGFYEWVAPDGSSVFTYGLSATPLLDPLDPKSNRGWLRYAAEREYLYVPEALPRELIYDYWFDYFIPQPDLPPYVREQNEAMTRFAKLWNDHYAGAPDQQIHPPRMTFTYLEEFFNEFGKNPLNLTTLSGDWPLNWAYYDEPAHREGLLAARLAHNGLLTAERVYACLGQSAGFGGYPQAEFTKAWMTNCWPDHGWGGNRGVETDAIFVAAYEASQQMADSLLNRAGAQLARSVSRASEKKFPLVIFNPLSWQRSDFTRIRFHKPDSWQGFTVRNDARESIPFDILDHEGDHNTFDIGFLAEGIPSLGYRRYFLESDTSLPKPEHVKGSMLETEAFKVTLGNGGIKSLYDKRLKWEVLETSKFDGGEIIQLWALGNAWDDPETVSVKDFDKTSNHSFEIRSFVSGKVRVSIVREAQFEHFLLREHFHFYHRLNRVDIDVELVNWDGQKERELRVVFPINLEQARKSYEVPFGTVELGKDELNFSLLPPDPLKKWFDTAPYGAQRALPFREAINWIDASDEHYLGHGCTSGSDMTVHLFQDETDNPISNPMLQHVLLSSRKSQAWNPENWFTQAGTHQYRTCLLPHQGDWRSRYREAIGFNYPLVCFLNTATDTGAGAAPFLSFMELKPANLVLTAFKKSEDGDHFILRFYEAEGFECHASVRLSKPIVRARRASLIEDDQGELALETDGSLRCLVKKWEIVTLKLSC